MTNYEITKQRILDLADEGEGEDDYGALSPTPYALETTLALLDVLHERLGAAFPRGYGGVEYRGGIDLTFNNLLYHVSILIPHKPKEQWYIYIGCEPSQLVYYPSVDFIVETIQNNET